MLVVESLTHAKARGANILAELVGYGATSDGYDMVAPSGEGAVRCMQQAMHGLEGEIDYINAHGTSTPAGDIQELNALRTVFGDQAPVIGSTKSLSGHSLGAAGVQEAIYSLLMIQDDFIAASANIETLDEGAEGMPIAMARVDNAGLQQVMSNSFGFGGTNATLIFRRYTGLTHRAPPHWLTAPTVASLLPNLPRLLVVPGAITARPSASLRLVMTPEL